MDINEMYKQASEDSCSDYKQRLFSLQKRQEQAREAYRQEKIAQGYVEIKNPSSENSKWIKLPTEYVLSSQRYKNDFFVKRNQQVAEMYARLKKEKKKHTNKPVIPLEEASPQPAKAIQIQKREGPSSPSQPEHTSECPQEPCPFFPDDSQIVYEEYDDSGSLSQEDLDKLYNETCFSYQDDPTTEYQALSENEISYSDEEAPDTLPRQFPKRFSSFYTNYPLCRARKEPARITAEVWDALCEAGTLPGLDVLQYFVDFRQASPDWRAGYIEQPSAFLKRAYWKKHPMTTY